VRIRPLSIRRLKPSASNSCSVVPHGPLESSTARHALGPMHALRILILRLTCLIAVGENSLASSTVGATAVRRHAMSCRNQCPLPSARNFNL
jgi:hypothetical protein